MKTSHIKNKHLTWGSALFVALFCWTEAPRAATTTKAATTKAATTKAATTKAASQKPASNKPPQVPAGLFKQAVSPKKAPAALEKVSARLTKTRVLRAKFTQTKKLKALRFPLTSTGHFLFASQHGIAWGFQKPFKVSFVITHHHITQRSMGKTTRISGKKKPLVLGFARMFLTIFQGNAAQLHKHFGVYFQGSALRWVMGLRPKHKLLQRIFKRVVLHGGQGIEWVELAERSGDTTHIRFAQTTSTPLTSQERSLFAHKP